MFVWLLEGEVSDAEEVGRQLGHWIVELGDSAPGYLGATAGVTDDRRFLMLVRWDSEESSAALLMRPEQHAWYDEFQQSFDGDVRFAESDDVTTFRSGGSDAAGFVQAMKVSGVDRQRIDEAGRRIESMAPGMRPDVIGGVRVWTAPDAYVEANYFTSEQDARAGEQQEPPPELGDGIDDFAGMTKDAEYFDFTEPLLHSPSRR